MFRLRAGRVPSGSYFLMSWSSGRMLSSHFGCLCCCHAVFSTFGRPQIGPQGSPQFLIFNKNTFPSNLGFEGLSFLNNDFLNTVIGVFSFLSLKGVFIPIETYNGGWCCLERCQGPDGRAHPDLVADPLEVPAAQAVAFL